MTNREWIEEEAVEAWVSKCEECMYDAPYYYCCKLECMEHEFCRNCNAKSKQVTNKCPYENM